MKKLEMLGRNLSKVEQKKITGGDMSAGQCVFCNRAQGEEGYVFLGCWYRKDSSGNADTICQGIYPAYNNVIGNWSECTQGCTMN